MDNTSTIRDGAGGWKGCALAVLSAALAALLIAAGTLLITYAYVRREMGVPLFLAGLAAMTLAAGIWHANVGGRR